MAPREPPSRPGALRHGRVRRRAEPMEHPPRDAGAAVVGGGWVVGGRITLAEPASPGRGVLGDGAEVAGGVRPQRFVGGARLARGEPGEECLVDVVVDALAVGLEPGRALPGDGVERGRQPAGRDRWSEAAVQDAAVGEVAELRLEVRVDQRPRLGLRRAERLADQAWSLGGQQLGPSSGRRSRSATPPTWSTPSPPTDRPRSAGWLSPPLPRRHISGAAPEPGTTGWRPPPRPTIP